MPKPDLDLMPESLDDLIIRMARKAAEGCCNNEAWQDGLCPYHAGYNDGLDALAMRITHALNHVLDDQT